MKKRRTHSHNLLYIVHIHVYICIFTYACDLNLSRISSVCMLISALIALLKHCVQPEG